MRKTLGVAVLMLAFSSPAFAGEMPTPPAPQTPQTTTQELTTTDEDTRAADTLTQIVLALLTSVLP
jgi:hypothetical protein